MVVRMAVHEHVLTAAALAAFTACGAGSTPKPDGTAIKVVDMDARISRVILDAERQSWFVLTPTYKGNAAVVCRLRDTALTCAQVPGSNSNEDYETRVD